MIIIGVGYDIPLPRYDLRMGERGSVTAEQVRWQAHQCGLLDCPDVTVFAARAYADVARAIWPYAFAPLAATRSQGEQHQVLAQITRMFTGSPVAA